MQSGAPGSQRLPPRVSRRADFLYVQGKGRRLRGKFVTLLWAPSHDEHEDARLGYTVSRKVGPAVVRNRVRRRLREAVRRSASTLVPRTWHVLIAHPQAAHEPFDHLSREVTWLLAKAHLAPSWLASHG